MSWDNRSRQASAGIIVSSRETWAQLKREVMDVKVPKTRHRFNFLRTPSGVLKFLNCSGLRPIPKSKTQDRGEIKRVQDHWDHSKTYFTLENRKILIGNHEINPKIWDIRQASKLVEKIVCASQSGLEMRRLDIASTKNVLVLIKNAVVDIVGI